MAAPTTSLHLGLGVDTRDFAMFVRALRKAEPDLRARLAVRMRGVGEIVAEEARSTAEEWSTSIPPSIRVRVAGATVAVVAGVGGVALAGLFELGNAKSRGGDVFSHPVFGRDVWVKQPMHPFLGKAVMAKIDLAETAAVDALDDAVQEIVTRG